MSTGEPQRIVQISEDLISIDGVAFMRYHRDIVNLNVGEIEQALAEFDGLRESRKRTGIATGMEYLEESPSEPEWTVKEKREDNIIEEIIKHNIGHNKSLNKYKMESELKRVLVSIELNSKFCTEVNNLEESIILLENKVRLFSGKSPKKVTDLMVDKELTSDNYISNTRDNLRRLECLNKDFVELLNLIDEYI